MRPWRRCAGLRAGVCGALAWLAVGSAPARAAGVLELRGKGVQVYACQASAAGFAWHLKRPEAVLLDRSGVAVGRHFAGPSWQAKDGSTVVGEVLVASASPQAGAIPWLLLRARSHAGAGAFASIGYIARTATRGGLAPAKGCDGGHPGAGSRVPYEATYLLFPQ